MKGKGNKIKWNPALVFASALKGFIILWTQTKNSRMVEIVSAIRPEIHDRKTSLNIKRTEPLS